MPDGVHVYNLPAIIDRVYHAIKVIAYLPM